MGARGRTGRAGALVAAAIMTGSALVGVTAGDAVAGSASRGASGGGGGKFDPGINSAAALAGPNCDAEREQVMFFYYAAAPCVKPWKEGADNGGATAQGVTKDSVKVVVLHNTPVPGPPTVSANFLVDQSTGKDGLPEDAILDYDAAYRSVYETWGRTVEYEFVQSGGSDEAAQRADAVTVAAMKPFAVLDLASLEGSTGGGPIFRRELAAAGVPIVSPALPSDPQNTWIPYMLPVAEFVGKALVGKPAEFAGDADLATKTRTFAVVYQGDALGSEGMDISIFRKELAAHRGRTVLEIEYAPGSSAEERTAKAQEQAGTLATRLKESGATTVVLFVDPRAMLPALLTQMTQQEYFPENIITTLGFQDISFYGRIMDQEQWAHAFGPIWFEPYVQGYTDPIQASFQWYWGTDQGTFCTCAFSLVAGLYNGIHLAGPKLTKATYRNGASEAPARGGFYSDSVTTLESAPGKPGQPNPAGRGYSLGWWDPDTEGPTQLQGVVGTGVTQYLDGGKRYVYGHFPKFAENEQPAFFDRTVQSTLYQLDAIPPQDVMTRYPCDDCPSNGGTAPAS